MNIRHSLFEPSLAHQEWTKDKVPDISVFLPWTEQDQLVTTVIGTINNTDKIVLLIGEQGIGKTTFVYRIQAQAPENWLLCRVDANPMLNFDQLLQRVARYISYDGSLLTQNKPAIQQEPKDDIDDDDSEPRISMPLGEAALSNNVYADCQNLRSRELIPVIIVDDAEQLPPRTLKSILRLYTRIDTSSPPFGLILLAEPLLQDQLVDFMRISRPDANRNPAFRPIEMPTLALAQMPAYTAHFFEMTGIPANHELFQDRLEIIHKDACGIPEKINASLMRTLHEQYVDVIDESQTSIGTRLMALLMGILLVGLAAFAALQFPATSDALKQLFGKEFGDVTIPTWISSVPSIFNSPTKNTILIDTNDSIPTTVAKIKPQSEPVRIAPPVPITPPVRLAANPTSVTPNATSPNYTVPTAPQQDTTPTTVTKPPTEPLTIGGQAWLQQLPADTYTIQLFATIDESAAQRYINSSKISKTAFYIATKHKNRRVFYVFQGTYPTRAAANAALNRLPASLRKHKPWPRLLGWVQSTVRN